MNAGSLRFGDVNGDSFPDICREAEDEIDDADIGADFATVTTAEIFIKPRLIASMAPLSLMVKRSNKAPNTIKRILNAITTPLTVEAIIQLKGVFQMTRARTSVSTNARGIARVEGQRNPTIVTKITMIGRAAIRASKPTDIGWRFGKGFKISKKIQ